MDAPYHNGSDEREDVCTENAETCECPECRSWRDNREGPEPSYDTPTLQEQYEAAWHEKRRLTR